MTYSYEQEAFKSAAQRVHDEAKLRSDATEKLLSFGVPYLDKTLGGILSTDLILLGAKTGAGKTEMAVTIAKNVARQKDKNGNPRRVHMFALEAEEAEVERRMKFQVMAEKVRERGHNWKLNFQDWYMGKYDFLGQYEKEAAEEIESYTNLFTFYRDSKFNLPKFERMFRSLDGQSDLVLVDHIHYFDFDSENENKAVGDIMKAIKDMSQLQKVPVILIAHLRKIGKQERTLLPAIEDFHGTSNISKIATRLVVMSNGGLDPETNKPIVYIQAAKNRYGGERTRVVCKTHFNPSTNSYDEKYQLGVLSPDETQFVPFKNAENIPDWLKQDL